MTDEPYLSETPIWQGFTLLSGSCEAESDSDLAVQAEVAAPEQIEHSSRTEFPLSQTRVGDRVRITLHRSHTEEVANAGITVGTEVQILSQTVSGSVIVRCNGRNIGVGAAIAQGILVTSLER